MADHPLTFLLQHLRQLAGTGAATERTDRQLLQRFAANGDEDAFALLVRRHGAMVFGVCRRLLSSHDAEDAFQATFVLLAQKAASAHWHESVAGWLHEAAQRVARHARRLAARRHGQERRAAALRAEAVPSPEAEALRRLWLDEELHRLPEKHRMPLVLCHLEGHSHEEAARLLGWPIGTVKGRIARALEQLRRRARGQGESLTGSGFAVVLAERLPSSVPPEALTRTTIHVAVLVARGAPVAETASATVAALLAGTFAGKVKTALALVMLLGILATGGAVAARRFASDTPTAAERPSAPTPPPDRVAVRNDLHGDPLPPGAIARIGSLRLWRGEGRGGLYFLPDGKTLCAISDNALRSWDTATGREVCSLPNQFNILGCQQKGKPLVWSTATDGKGRQIDRVSTPQDGAIYCWDVTTGVEARRFPWPETLCEILTLSDDCKTLAGWSVKDYRIHLWDTTTLQDLGARIEEPYGGLSCLHVLRGSRNVISSSTFGVGLWEASKGYQGPRTLFRSERGYKIVASVDGGVLAFVSWDQSKVILWDVGRNEALHELKGAAEHFGPLTFTPDGRTLVGATKDKKIQLWDVATAKLKHAWTVRGEVISLAVSPEGKRLAWQESSRIHLSELTTGKELVPIPAHPENVAEVAFAPDARTVVSLSIDGSVSFWGAATGKERLRRRKPPDDFPPWESRINWPGLSSDGVRMWAADRNHGVRVWQTATGKLVRSIGKEVPDYFSPDSKLLIDRFAAGGCIRLRDAATARTVSVLSWPTREQVNELILSPDSRLLATSHDLPSAPDDLKRKQTMFIRIWDTASGREYCRIEGGTDRFRHLIFSSDARMLGGVSDANEVHVFEVSSGRQRWKFVGHRGKIRALAFSRDGRLLVSASDDHTMLTWDLTGKWRRDRGPRAKLQRRQLDEWWEELAAIDAQRAQDALWKFVAADEQGVAFLAERLQPASPLDLRQLAQLLADLDSDEFNSREKASRKLEELAEQAAPILRLKLAEGPSLELRHRIERILQKTENGGLSRESLRRLRGIEVLERLGTPAARQVLQRLAGGSNTVRQTREAQASLNRLSSHCVLPSQNGGEEQ